MNDSSSLLQEPQKSVLANVIWNLLKPDILDTSGDIQYVLDGGALYSRLLRHWEQHTATSGPGTLSTWAESNCCVRWIW